MRNGNIGIGVLNPGHLLDINGRARFRHNGETSGCWYNNSSNAQTVFAGMNSDTRWGIYGGGWKFYFDINNGEAYKASGSTAWIIASDARLKENIHPYADGLQQLLQIEPVWFTYKSDMGLNTSKPYVGVLAQDLQKITPYMVGNDVRNGERYLNVDNSPMVYMLINAVKEQQKQIEELKKEIAILKER